MGEKESELRLKNYFSRYYESWTLRAPELLQSREIGFIPFFGTMTRHRKANSIKEMDNFVKTAVPRHLYYSSAYYRKPDEKKMLDKEWLGAELIFDLDADHIESAKKMSYEETLELIRDHTVRLIERFLLDTFGFDEKDIRVFFSGGRGYHVHILSDRVYPMTSDSRREIASYIRGEGLKLEDFLKAYKTVPLNHGGWAQEISTIVRKEMGFPTTISAGNPLIEVGSMKSAGVRKQKAAAKALEEFRLQTMAEIDEPVTTDVHRLIRYPGSLHGKTGFEVKEVSISSLHNFEPLENCIPAVFTDEDVDVEASAHFKIRLMGTEYELQKGRNSVPLYVALYTVLSGRGQFIPNIS